MVKERRGLNNSDMAWCVRCLPVADEFSCVKFDRTTSISRPVNS